VPYVVLFAAGLSGLLVMMLLGFAHMPHHHHKHAHARGPARVTARAGVERATVEQVSIVGRSARWLGPLMSPLTWFSWMFGGGAAGMIAIVMHASPRAAFIVALTGAALFQLFVVRPIWKLVFRFESQPAGNLEGCLMQEVEVIRAFNARGEGLVRVVVDGRTEDVLGVLTKSERDVASRPRRGDRVLIEDIDTRTNTCIVSRT
jgi:hypothetical protein